MSGVFLLVGFYDVKHPREGFLPGEFGVQLVEFVVVVPGLLVELRAHGVEGGLQAGLRGALQFECDLGAVVGVGHEPEAAVDGVQFLHRINVEVGIDEGGRFVEIDDDLRVHYVEVVGVLEKRSERAGVKDDHGEMQVGDRGRGRGWRGGFARAAGE